MEAERGEVPLHPVLVELQELLAADALLRTYLERMLTEEPKGKPYGTRHIQDPAHLSSCHVVEARPGPLTSHGASAEQLP